MALVVEVKEGGVWGAAVKGAILRCMCIHRSGTNENQGYLHDDVTKCSHDDMKAKVSNRLNVMKDNLR